MQLFFALTLLVSATLLFLVQPMFAKMVLPMLGGTPAVWNTCMVFYQAALLAGYLYAHFSTRWLGARRQAAVHLVLLCLPWLVLPIGVAQAWAPPGDAPNPIPWLLVLLAFSVGLPFFVVSASAPMLQAWFAETGHPAGKDPYFLYAASNLGSMLALIGYPTLVEPSLRLRFNTADGLLSFLSSQSGVWTLGYGGLMLLTCGCAVLLWRSRRGAAAGLGGATAPANQQAFPADPPDAAPTLPLRLRWLALSFAPSSLLLGATTYISTDIAAVPLLWIIPLTLYLLSFVLVFARWPTLLCRWVRWWQPDQPALAAAFDPHWILFWIQPLLVVGLAMVFFQTAAEKMGWMILLHLAVLFVTAMVCHGELARSRPGAGHLTEFYIWMSAGGVLGGIFNALVAPLVFPTVAEYPLVIAVACMLRPQLFRPRHPAVARWLDLVLPVSVFAVLALFVHLERGWNIQRPWLSWEFGGWDWNSSLNALVTTVTGRQYGITVEMAILGLGGLAALLLALRPLRFGLAVGAVLLAGHLWFSMGGDVIYADRSFFGVMRIRRTTYPYVNGDNERAEGYRHILVHGSTNHGEQRFDPQGRHKPITYYFPTGPIGEVFTRLIDPNMHRQIGITGLGTGTTAAYGHPGQRFTYFEIDPHVKRIAEDPRYFAYLSDTPAEYRIVMGDARLSLEKQRLYLKDHPGEKFDLLLMDAYSSDAIPIHMITKEAVALYFDVLKERGLLLVHISNRHLDLAPVVGNIARDLGLTARYRNDTWASALDKDLWDEEADEGKFASDVVLVVRDPEYLGPLKRDGAWEEIPQDPRVGVWTDDFSDILTVLTWLHKEDEEEE